MKEETSTQTFSCEFCKIFKNTWFHRTPLLATKCKELETENTQRALLKVLIRCRTWKLPHRIRFPLGILIKNFVFRSNYREFQIRNLKYYLFRINYYLINSQYLATNTETYGNLVFRFYCWYQLAVLPVVICLKSTIETPEQCAKSVQN